LRLPYKNHSKTKFVAALLQETLNPFDFYFRLKLKKRPGKNLSLRLKPGLSLLYINLGLLGFLKIILHFSANQNFQDNFLKIKYNSDQNFVVQD
jgi:hypothetical protein